MIASAHAQIQSDRKPQLVRVATQPFTEMQRRIAGPQRMVLVGDGCPNSAMMPSPVYWLPFPRTDARLREDFEEAIEYRVPLFCAMAVL